MDTYVHIAVGAALGSKVYEVIESRSPDSGKSIEIMNNKIHMPAVAAGILVSLASHLITDAVPHGDYLVRHGFLIPNRYWPVREFIASLMVFGFILLKTHGRIRWVALLTGLMGGLPDIESLFLGINVMEKKQALFPTHNGLISHGKNLRLISLAMEFGSLLFSLGWFIFRPIPSKR